MIPPNIEKYFTFLEFIFKKNHFLKKNYFSINNRNWKTNTKKLLGTLEISIHSSRKISFSDRMITSQQGCFSAIMHAWWFIMTQTAQSCDPDSCITLFTGLLGDDFWQHITIKSTANQSSLIFLTLFDFEKLKYCIPDGPKTHVAIFN
jgi:hypothetical protein